MKPQNLFFAVLVLWGVIYLGTERYAVGASSTLPATDLAEGQSKPISSPAAQPLSPPL